jgi:hypothetical protein
VLTRFFGAPASVALAAALVVHALSYLPVLLVGLTFMAQEGLTLARLRSVDATPSGGGAA